LVKLGKQASFNGPFDTQAPIRMSFPGKNLSAQSNALALSGSQPNPQLYATRKPCYGRENRAMPL